MDLKQQHNPPISQGRRQRLPFLYFLKALTFFNISQRLPAKNAVYRPESGRSVRKGRIVKLRIRAKIRTKTAAFSHKRDSFRCVFVKKCAPYTQKTGCTGRTPRSRLFFLWILPNSQQRRRFPLLLFRQFLSVRSRFVRLPVVHTAPPAQSECCHAVPAVPVPCLHAL